MTTSTGTTTPSTPATASTSPATTSTSSTTTSNPVQNPGDAWAHGTAKLTADRRSFKLWGDPHAVAGDGKKFDNENVGTMTQLKSASGDFELQTTQAHPPGKPHVTVNCAAALKLGKDVVSYDVSKNQIVLNKKPVTLKSGQTMMLPDGGMLARDPKGNLTVTSAAGDTVNFKVAHWGGANGPAYLNLDGQLGANRTDGEVRGALGSFHNAGSGDANADFVGRDGKEYDAQYNSGGTYKSIVSDNHYNEQNVGAFEQSWMVPSSDNLMASNAAPGTQAVDPTQWTQAADQTMLKSGQKSQLGLPQSGTTNSPTSSGPLKGATSKDGNSLPATSGRATTFWNGAYSYKGVHDTENMSGGAWGDPNKPTDYICALPVGLNGGGDWWHNQKILVTNPSNGKQVVVQVQDKGPAPSTGNAIDLSPVAKEALGVNFMDNLDVHMAFAPDNASVGPLK